ncbi:MAG: DUF3795 domain-containing protein [Desulfomonilia bacterium]
MDYRRMTAPCGLDCFNCPMYQARDNEKLRSMISERRGIPLEEAYCNGCRDEGGMIGFLKMTQPCNVFRCISAKGLDFCSECDEFPCDYLHPYADRAAEVPHNTKVFNLCLIKRMGLEEWARDKAKNVKQTYFKGTFKL